MQAVKPTKVSFTLDGSFEVESHHLEDHHDLDVR